MGLEAQLRLGLILVRPARAHSYLWKYHRELTTANEAMRDCVRVTECGEEGKTLETAEEILAEITSQAATFAEKLLPSLKALQFA